MPAPSRSRLPADARARLAGLDDFANLLHSTPSRDARGRHTAAQLLLVPSVRRPRLVVPGSARRAAANAVLRHGVATTVRERMQRRALSWALRSGAGPWLFRGGRQVLPAGDCDLTHHLSEVLGRPVLASMALTPPRANRKPVLHLLDTDGRTVAFAKIGINELTAELVRREAETLELLAGTRLSAFRVPEVLHCSAWRSLQLLLLSPFRTWEGTAPTRAALRAAMRQLAGSGAHAEPGGAGGYPAVLQERARAMQKPARSDDLATLTSLGDLAADLSGTAEAGQLRLGSWHGDWTPWNCRQLGAELVVWDWERASHGVPMGFDALHHQLQQSLVGPAASTRAAADTCISSAPAVLAPWGIGPAEARLTAALYLLEIGLRYLSEDQRAAGGRGGDVNSWILPAVAGFAHHQRHRGIAT
jgi:hypothetical protein